MPKNKDPISQSVHVNQFNIKKEKRQENEKAPEELEFKTLRFYFYFNSFSKMSILNCFT